MPRLRPCPASGCTLWAASPIRAILWETYSFDICRAKGKAYLLVLRSDIRGGVSNCFRFIWSGKILSGRPPIFSDGA